MGAHLSARVLVVGAGISGGACASALRAAGVDVLVRERGRAPGGRLASPQLHGRRVDLGAAYFTVSDDDFAAVVEDWRRGGLVRPWTDTLAAYSPDARETKPGPVRWAAPGGLRSLAHAMHSGVELGNELTALPADFDAVVLAMPDPQAARLAGDVVPWVDYEPVIAVAAGFASRTWPFEAAFVNDDPDIALIADDGARRGDAAPVLVVHTTPGRAHRHLADPHSAVEPVVDAVRRLLDTPDPEWTHVHRWTFAKPASTHDAPYFWNGSLGICGDSWCPQGSPRVEAAWLSGHRLGSELARRLA